MSLRRLRQNAGFTLKEAADSIGYDSGNLSRIERNKQNLTLSVAKKLSQLYNAPLDVIVSNCTDDN